MKIEIRPISMKFKPYILHNLKEIFAEFQLFLLIARGHKRGRRPPWKFKYVQFWWNLNHMYSILIKGDFQIFSSFRGAKGCPRPKGGTRGQKTQWKFKYVQFRWNLRGEVWFMEIVFVGECEVFVCLCFVVNFFFSLDREAHRSENWASIL